MACSTFSSLRSTACWHGPIGQRIGQYKNTTAEVMIPSRSAGGFGFLTQTAVPLSALFGAERTIDVGSSVRILRGNDLLAGTA